ncbi:unnamed protein product, partial [marine sediment metagenome]
RFVWKSGVSLCFDEDPELREKAHRGRITLDVPGKACDELTAPDLLLFMEGLQDIGCNCSRIDVFLDDYKRTATMDDYHLAAAKGDYTMFQISSENRTRNRTRKENDGLVYDAVTFGRRGSKGSGSFLRIYDKFLESNGESNCIRLEIEFTQHKAQKVFNILSGADGNLDVFAACCGALIGGCISFVHRTPEEKHISRLEPYDWWEEIIRPLGKLSVRISKKQNTLTGMIEWTEHQVSPTLFVIAKAFKTEQDFYNWIQRLRDIGDGKVNIHQRQVAEQNAGSLVYNQKFNREKQRSDYLNAMCVQVS